MFAEYRAASSGHFNPQEQKILATNTRYLLWPAWRTIHFRINHFEMVCRSARINSSVNLAPLDGNIVGSNGYIAIYGLGIDNRIRSGNGARPRVSAKHRSSGYARAIGIRKSRVCRTRLLACWRG